MSISPYINIFLLVVSFQLLYYIGRQRILEGIYAIARFSIFISSLVGVSFMGFAFSSFRQQEFLIVYTLILNLMALGLSYIPSLQKRLNKILQSMWFFSLLALMTGGLLSIGFQYSVLSIRFETPYTFSDLVLVGFFIGFLMVLTAYFCMPLYYFHMARRRQSLISFQLEPILSALAQELEDYKSQLAALSSENYTEVNRALIQALEEKLQASKLPLYADSTDVSMTLYPLLTEHARSNTWVQVNLFPLPSAELAFLLNLICSYLNEYDPNLLKGVQLTPLTEGRIIIEIEKDLISFQHLHLFLKRQKLMTPKGHAANHHIRRISLRYLLTQNHIGLKHVVMENARQTLVLSV